MDDGSGSLQAAARGAAAHLPDAEERGPSGRRGADAVPLGGPRQDCVGRAGGAVKRGEKDPKTNFLVHISLSIDLTQNGAPPRKLVILRAPRGQQYWMGGNLCVHRNGHALDVLYLQEEVDSCCNL